MKVETIKNNYEFRRLYSKGERAGSPRLVIYCRRNRLGVHRLGITVSTKLGKAVHRNKIRRRLKEIFRLNSHRLENGWDIVVVAKQMSRGSDYHELEADFLRTCGRLGLLIPDVSDEGNKR